MMVLVGVVMDVNGIYYYEFIFLTILRVHDETALFDGRVYCRNCMSQKFPENKTAKFEPTDAKFKCPKKKCDADQLTYAEFFIGTCCENASLWAHDTCKIEISFEKKVKMNI